MYNEVKVLVSALDAEKEKNQSLKGAVSVSYSNYSWKKKCRSLLI